jgi:uncharacterized protein (DUF1800 family)
MSDSPADPVLTAPSPLSRRALLGAGLGATALLGASRRAEAQIATGAGNHTARMPEPSADLRFLVERTSFGFRGEVLLEAQSLGWQGFLERQLAPQTIDDSALDLRLASFPTLAMTPREIWTLYGFNGQLAIPIGELEQAAVLRAVLSKRQLKERMVEFWSDHFSIDHLKDECQMLKTADDRDVVRVHALGRFPELLVASAHSGAMLDYLDNRSNKVGSPNENYARELLELHTLGVGHYTENDIKELARCLTGWTIYPRSHEQYGGFRFEPAWHDTGAKSLLGITIPAGGNTSDGDTVLALLGMHPQTARFVGKKLARHLLSYEPPAALVDELVSTWASTGGDVKALIRVILRPDSVVLAQPGAHPKLRRPFHLACALLRSSNAQIAEPAEIVEELEALGQAPFRWLTPDGCPDTLAAWGNALLPRWTFASRLFDGQIAGTVVDVGALCGTTPNGALAARIDALLTGGRLDASEVAALQGWISALPAVTDAKRREAFALAASCPSYQWF